jgi:hypothetical protein
MKSGSGYALIRLLRSTEGSREKDCAEIAVDRVLLQHGWSVSVIDFNKCSVGIRNWLLDSGPPSVAMA